MFGARLRGNIGEHTRGGRFVHRYRNCLADHPDRPACALRSL